MPEEMPPVILDECYDEIVRKRICEALLSIYKKDIRDNYYVSAFVQFPDGNWVIRLERTRESYETKP